MSQATQTLSATGRRKTAVARVRLAEVESGGSITINGRPFEEYLPTLPLQNAVLAPLQQVNVLNRFNVTVTAKGGGLFGQADAIRMAVARALLHFDAELRKELKPHGFLRRDPRMKERKKSGQPGARKRFQFSKR